MCFNFDQYSFQLDGRSVSHGHTDRQRDLQGPIALSYLNKQTQHIQCI